MPTSLNFTSSDLSKALWCPLEQERPGNLAVARPCNKDRGNFISVKAATAGSFANELYGGKKKKNYFPQIISQIVFWPAARENLLLWISQMFSPFFLIS